MHHPIAVFRLPYHRRGLSLIYSLITLSVMIGFASLAVDLGRVQVAKTELRRTADAAARAAASSLSSGVAAAQSAAVSIAAANTVDGQSHVLETASDIEFGTWDITARTFTVLSGAARSNANAVRVTTRRTAARGTAIPLSFARFLGQSTLDVTAKSTAYNSGRRAELVGLGGITVKNNFFGGTYHSSTTTTPAHETAEDGVYAASNSVIEAKHNENIAGVILGPSGSHNLTLSDGAIVMTQAISFPLPTGGTSTTDFNISGTVYVAGGTYYANDLTIANGGSLVFTGPATLYLSGAVKFNGDVTISASGNVPGNLNIYHTGTGSFGSATANNVTITASVYCPGVDFAVKNNALLRGRFIFKSIFAKNNLDYYYDEALTPLYFNGGSGVMTVQ